MVVNVLKVFGQWGQAQFSVFTAKAVPTKTFGAESAPGGIAQGRLLEAGELPQLET